MNLYQSQVKRVFTPNAWRDGQNLFRGERVKEVKLRGIRVTAQVVLPNYKTTTFIDIARGTIAKSECTCGKNHSPDRGCEHVAALCVWVMTRGSLLRAGVLSEDDGVAESQDSPEDENTPVDGEALTYVRALFEGDRFIGISLEPGVRFTAPKGKEPEVQLLSRMSRQYEYRTWRTTDGTYVRVKGDGIPFLETIDANKVVYQGPAGLENIAEILNRREVMESTRTLYVHPDADFTFDKDTLKLQSIRIGMRHDQQRVVIYSFKNATTTFNSDQLHELSKKGRLSQRYVLRDNILFRFEQPLDQLSRYSNRSGVNPNEGKPQMIAPDGYGHLEDNDGQPLHPLAAFRLSLELGVENLEVDPEWKEFHEWKKLFDKKRIPTLPSVEYGFELRDYQINGLNWMWSLFHRGLAALLADDMGLGKTHQVMAFMSSIYINKKDQAPSLVVAPTSVVAAWSQKLKKYDTGLTWMVFHGQGRKLPEKLPNFVLTTYGLLQREPALWEQEWNLIILDEAQAIKNAGTISSRAARLLKSKFRIAMTGTPVENQSTDLWSIMEFLLPGYLGSLPRFKRLYGYGREKPTQQQADTLKRLVNPFLLRRTKSQVLKELPEKTEEVVQIDMTPAQRKAYRAVLNSQQAAKVRQNLEDSKKVDYANVLALLTKLKQICDHPVLPDITAGMKPKELAEVDPFLSGKWEVLAEILEEAQRSNLKTVIFTQYLGMMDLTGLYLKTKDIGYTELRGDTHDRSKRLDRFAADPDCKVFLCSLLAGGLGIDLTSASVCIHLDRWWNPAKENQATDRLHRMGQTRGVQVFKLMMNESVEGRIADIIASKTQLSGALIEESAVGLKTFSREELLDLITSFQG